MLRRIGHLSMGLGYLALRLAKLCLILGTKCFRDVLLKGDSMSLRGNSSRIACRLRHSKIKHPRHSYKALMPGEVMP